MQGLNLDLENPRSNSTWRVFEFEPESEAERQLILTAIQPREVIPEQTRSSSEFDIRRVLDIIASIALIVALAPLLLLIAVTVVATDPGPPVFAQRRVGKNGKMFRCFKFRSMCVDAEGRLERILTDDPLLKSEWECSHKLIRDPRITRVGQFLRISSLDELPQLFNVLSGNMTLVGPRPIVTSEILQYGRFASYYLSLKPGLTGLWQVTGRSSVSYRRRVAADVLYVRTRSLGLDFRILLATVPAVFFGWGAC